MMSFSCHRGGDDGPDENTQDTTNVTPPVETVNRALMNFVWMSTQDSALMTLSGATLKISKENGPVLFFMPDVREQNELIFDWYPDLSCSVDTLYELKVNDSSGNLVDKVLFNPALATGQDEFVINSVKCTYFLQLTWSVEQ
jgi:hypothetical protein